MTINERVEALSFLGSEIQNPDRKTFWEKAVDRAQKANPWFTPENVNRALQSIATKYLHHDRLNFLISHYSISNPAVRKKVGIVMAGNIPAVGFHDLLSVFIAGHHAVIKYSNNDDVLIPLMLDVMIKKYPEANNFFTSVERLSNYDAVIATGGNNTSKHFEYYFKHVPHIIRKSRNGIAVLSGNESREELIDLGKDVFTYFGLGCRNVSHTLIPYGYDLKILLEALDHFQDISYHHKYKNNFDYNMALFLLNKVPFLHNQCILLKKDDAIASRIACLHYSYYTDGDSIEKFVTEKKEEIQCIVSNSHVNSRVETFRLGEAQSPGIVDYADGVDTIQFLLSL